MSEGAPRERLLDNYRLIEGNLIDVHWHKHAKMKHNHPYLHKPPQEHDNNECNS